MKRRGKNKIMASFDIQPGDCLVISNGKSKICRFPIMTAVVTCKDQPFAKWRARFTIWETRPGFYEAQYSTGAFIDWYKGSKLSEVREKCKNHHAPKS